MKFIVVFTAVVLTVTAVTEKKQWKVFKQTHSKTYKSILEERTRFGIFQNNLRTIEEHNFRYEQGQETYYMGVNRFADMTEREFKSMLGLQNKDRPNLNATRHVFPENLEVPESIDWTEKGAVLDVKDQAQCGSCWAFSATGALEGQNAILNNVKTPLSEQQLIDCSGSYGNHDCGGGLITNAFKYVEDNGIEAETTYSYQANAFSCRYDSKNTVLKIKGYKEIDPSEEELKKAVGTIGPISVALNSAFLQFYAGGILSRHACTLKLDHAVLAVGYGSSNGIKYWKVKNSWGSSWGEQGYFKIARDANNMCGIASMTSYPLL